MSRRSKYGLPLALVSLVACLLLAHEFALLDGAPAPVPRAGRELTNSIGMEFVRIPAGKFLMGSSKEEKNHHESQEPRHEVEISRPFYLGVYEVTQAQYKKVMGVNPSVYCAATATGRLAVMLKGLDTDTFPVTKVGWHDARRFCARLAALPEEARARRTYRLPTEAEWEYACRAGTTTTFYYGDTLTCKEANFQDQACEAAGGKLLRRPTTVGSYRPNAFGLYDMHGNVAEWCLDWIKWDYYKEAPRKDPRGPSKKPPDGQGYRVVRGGAYSSSFA